MFDITDQVDIDFYFQIEDIHEEILNDNIKMNAYCNIVDNLLIEQLIPKVGIKNNIEDKYNV